ncbi:endolytic transglycosylase MltG [Anoxybacillus ayderensis]|uniref:endolytic transglycosylase MltG n=1 Tax=Anoxybacillus ayderensis TaxID=265546 RepID=UPI002E2293F4|nr:endolytic transglycosylase MltG [Anoxybacillus ayderensis]MED0687723.1 endolytic transglycosylase MltG [Anoxybacillus ayderensis]
MLQEHEAKTVRKIVLYITAPLLLFMVAACIGLFVYIRSALQPIDPSDKTPIQVEIPIGSSVYTIANILEKNGVVKDATIFRYYVKFKNHADFQAGNYTFTKAMTFEQIVKQLKTGKVVKEPKLKITIPEGKQLTQIATIMSQKTGYSTEDIMAKLTNRTYIEELMKKYPSVLTADILNKNIRYALEGYLFPATYSFTEEKPPLEEMIETMIAKTEEILAKYTEDMEARGMTVHQLLTMASLIEEEATEKADREKIASVFYNRLEKGMPLQTDPTVLYALGKHKQRVYYKDLEVNSPYNTYMHKGLPPGPIANAGEMSLHAALHPAETDYFYFLATPTGDVIFTKTLDEHNREKAKYIGKQ